LEEKSKGAKERIRGGVVNRVLDVPADADAGMGLFENTHGLRPEEFANALKEASLKIYGAPFRCFVERLSIGRDVYLDLAGMWVRQFDQERCPAAASAEVRRGCHRFAVIAAAGELATLLGLTGWRDGDAMAACEVCFDAWIQARGGPGEFDNTRILRAIVHYLQSHPPAHAIEGQALTGSYYVQNGLYLIPREVLHADVCPGIDRAQVYRALREKNLLVSDADRSDKQVRMGSNGRQRFVAIRTSIMDE
jgi:putative DNA primase/helicase